MSKKITNQFVQPDSLPAELLFMGCVIAKDRKGAFIRLAITGYSMCRLVSTLQR